MDYAAARAFLDRLPRYEVKPGLERVRRLLDAVGRPERTSRAIHVAGTNGKGSVVAMLASVLHRAGFRVGRYTSPELVDFRDRVVVDGAWISEEALALGVDRLQEAIDAGDPASQFEAITALAFDHFARLGVDLAVIEVGLGGRFDATNVVSPILTVLTNVTLDHQWILGESLEEIAWEKAGIAKAGVPLICGDLDPTVQRVVAAECARVGAEMLPSGTIDVTARETDWTSAHYTAGVSGRRLEIELPLPGRYQEENLRVVLRAVDALREKGLDIPDDAIVEGLREVTWPGRFEIVHRDPIIVLEGAHNPAGAERLAADIVARVPDPARRHLLFGVLGDKNAREMLDVLGPAFGSIALCQSSSPRALPVTELRQLTAARALDTAWYHSVAEALEGILPTLCKADVLVVAGSLTVVAEARQGLTEERWRR